MLSKAISKSLIEIFSTMDLVYVYRLKLPPDFHCKYWNSESPVNVVFFGLKILHVSLAILEQNNITNPIFDSSLLFNHIFILYLGYLSVFLENTPSFSIQLYPLHSFVIDLLLFTISHQTLGILDKTVYMVFLLLVLSSLYQLQHLVFFDMVFD